MVLPQDFKNKMQNLLKDEFDDFLKGYEKDNFYSLRINTLKAQLSDVLDKNLFDFTPVKWCPTGYYYPGNQRPGRHSYHHAGVFYIQEASAMAVVECADIRHGDKVLDLCAAPGGKTYTIAEEMNNTGEVLSFDIHEHRVKLIQSGAERLGLTCIKATVGDATSFYENLGEADAVLCDVPCSGFGIIGRKPEIKYKNPDEVKQLPSLQLQILQTGAKYVKEGGRLVYSTCTLSHSENSKVCKRFLQSTDDFKVVSPFKDLSDDEFLTLMPHKHCTDGFFIACFERKKQNEN